MASFLDLTKANSSKQEVVYCTRPSCKRPLLKSNLNSYTLATVAVGKPLVPICNESCLEHYKQKAVKREGEDIITVSQTAAAQISREVSKAQRRDPDRQPVARFGHIQVPSYAQGASLTPNPSAFSPPSFLPAPPKPPVLQAPGRLQGYGADHVQYNALAGFSRYQAANKGIDSIGLDVWMKKRNENGKTEVLANTLFAHIDVRTDVLAADLKELAFNRLVPKFKKWSMDFPLEIGDVALMAGETTELEAEDRHPEFQPAIFDLCYSRPAEKKGRVHGVTGSTVGPLKKSLTKAEGVYLELNQEAQERLFQWKEAESDARRGYLSRKWEAGRQGTVETSKDDGSGWWDEPRKAEKASKKRKSKAQQELEDEDEVPKGEVDNNPRKTRKVAAKRKHKSPTPTPAPSPSPPPPPPPFPMPLSSRSSSRLPSASRPLFHMSSVAQSSVKTPNAQLGEAADSETPDKEPKLLIRVPALSSSKRRVEKAPAESSQHEPPSNKVPKHPLANNSPFEKSVSRIDPSALAKALVSQGIEAPSADILATLSTTSTEVNVYPLRVIELEDLIGRAGNLSSTYVLDTNCVAGTLEIGNEIGSGGFKVARTGKLLIDPQDEDRLPFSFDPDAVAVKQCYQKRPTDGKRIVYDSDKACELTVAEANLIIWANALMRLVYGFVDVFLGNTNPDGPKDPPFEIPQLRFVSAALCHTRTQPRRYYLLEELLSTNGWTKFIHNGSSRITPSASQAAANDPELAQRAEFLIFAQHVQYIQTGKLIFVADLQGVGECLTDPQLITSPTLSNLPLFSNANMAHTFANFETEHVCNQYCQYFELEPFEHAAPENNH